MNKSKYKVQIRTKWEIMVNNEPLIMLILTTNENKPKTKLWLIESDQQ